RCDSRRALEFHHVRPYGVGGAATVANIQLRCRPHNGHEVELFYGKDRRYGSDVAREPQSAYGSATRSHPFRNV
ncbi:MAG TPA: HNH endonuclease, partial [Vicinamibacteria bacterium]|nr:HNH endonuclease [Vicinamibacteria bacterium]